MSDKLTVMQVFEATADKHSSKPAMKVKVNGDWQTTSWTEYRTQVRAAAKSLIAVGMDAGKGLSIIGFNCPQWLVSDMAAIYAGGFPAGIYTTNSPEQCKYIAEHSDSQVAVCENADQLAKFLEIRDQLPMLKKCVLMNGTSDDDGVLSWDDFMKAGESVSDEDLQARIDGQGVDDVCTFIYTSGTTGDPKAVMISHDNITWTADTALKTLGAVDGDRFISYLPLSHIAEQVISLHGPMVAGGCTYFAESIEKLGDNLREVRPTIFLAVPRVWEKIQAKMVTAGKETKGLKRKLVDWAKRKGLEAGFAAQDGKPEPAFLGIANKLVHSKVRDALGLDECRLMITSAAPISRSTLEFFLALGIPIMEVYGMSECTGPATISMPYKYRTGSVGWVIPGGEVKIAEDGEICMRGRHVFKGYYKNEAATEEALDSDNWLHSGDIGVVDDQGFLSITDRKKDLIITAGGENIAPQVIEGKLKAIEVVSQVVVIGDRRKHLSALFTIDESKVQETIELSGSPAKTMEELSTCETATAWLMTQVNEINKDLARVQTIKKIKILPRDLSIEGGELTPTMKVKRKIVNANYEAEIEAFYA